MLIFSFSFVKGQQGSNLWEFSYQVSFPTGETSSFIDNTSFLGFGFNYRNFIKDGWAIGGSISWNIFNERSDRMQDFRLESDDFPNPISGTLTGTQFRYINAVPIQFTTHYYFDDPIYGDATVVPFAGLGIGGTVVNQRTEIGILAIDVTNFHFGLTPEAGLLFPFETINLNVGLKYHYAFKTSDSRNHSYLSLQVGLVSDI